MVAESNSRPYAPAAGVTAALQRFRRRNLPEKVDVAYLMQAGSSKELAGRTLIALRFLGVVTEDGTPTEALRSLARSTDEEYRQTLEGILRDRYSEIFLVTDPSEDTRAEIENAFRRYEPASQHYRMAALFLGLVAEAGIPIREEPRRRSPQQPRPQPRPTGAPRPIAPRADRRHVPGPGGESAAAQASAVLWGYFKRLPRPGTPFAPAERDAWLDGMRAAFAFEYPEKEETPSDSE